MILNFGMKKTAFNFNKCRLSLTREVHESEIPNGFEKNKCYSTYIKNINES